MSRHRLSLRQLVISPFLAPQLPSSDCSKVSEQMLFYPPKFDDDGIPVDPATYRFGGRICVSQANIVELGPSGDRRDYKFWDDPYLLGCLAHLTGQAAR